MVTFKNKWYMATVSTWLHFQVSPLDLHAKPNRFEHFHALASLTGLLDRRTAFSRPGYVVYTEKSWRKLNLAQQGQLIANNDVHFVPDEGDIGTAWYGTDGFAASTCQALQVDLDERRQFQGAHFCFTPVHLRSDQWCCQKIATSVRKTSDRMDTCAWELCTSFSPWIRTTTCVSMLTAWTSLCLPSWHKRIRC
jgi:hypothetical protein